MKANDVINTEMSVSNELELTISSSGSDKLWEISEPDFDITDEDTSTDTQLYSGEYEAQIQEAIQ